MSGWKARIGYLSPSVFETPSDWDYILPKGFTIVASGLNVQAHTTEEFNKAIDALGKGLGIFSAEVCDTILLWGITRWAPNAAMQQSRKWSLSCLNMWDFPSARA
jgi:hypothetical protein